MIRKPLRRLDSAENPTDIVSKHTSHSALWVDSENSICFRLSTRTHRPRGYLLRCPCNCQKYGRLQAMLPALTQGEQVFQGLTPHLVMEVHIHCAWNIACRKENLFFISHVFNFLAQVPGSASYKSWIPSLCWSLSLRNMQLSSLSTKTRAGATSTLCTNGQTCWSRVACTWSARPCVLRHYDL